METNKILKASSLELLFDGRNQAYGAYQLRDHYIDRMRTAIGLMIAMVLVFTGVYFLTRNKENAVVRSILKVDPVHIETYKKPKAPEKKIMPVIRKAPPKVEMHKLTKPKITPDKQVQPLETPPKQADHIKVGPVTQHGMAADGLLATPPELKGVGGTGKGPGDGAANGADYNGIFLDVAVEASYPGGPAAWKKFLERNLRQQTPIDNGATPGLYSVLVSFLVAKDGSTSEIKVLSAPDPDYGTAAEAIRVIERSGKWSPAIQNGRQVIYREKQRIIFQVE